VLVASVVAHVPLLVAAQEYFEDGAGNSLSREMFSVEPAWPCSRLISRLGVIGCGSQTPDGAGEGGSLFLVENVTQLMALLEDNRGLSTASLVVADNVFDGDFARLAKEVDEKSVRVANIIVTVSNGIEGELPAQIRSSNLADEWVTNGDGLNYELLSFPVVRLKSANETERVLELARSNRDRGYADASFQHASRFKFYLGREDTDTEECLMLQRCDPLGGLSVWGRVGDLFNDTKESVLLTTGIDSNAFFHDLAFGRDSAASGTVALLAAAKALADTGHESLSALDKQILVAFFHAEVWDKIGSRKFVHDISSGLGCIEPEAALPYNGSTCANPLVYSRSWEGLRLKNITDVIGVRDVASGTSTGGPRRRYFVHAADDGGSIGSQTTFANIAAASSADLVAIDVQISSEAERLPPSPVDAFLQSENENAVSWNGNAVVFSGFDTNVPEANPAFHSRFDRGRPGVINEDAAAARIADVALLLARHAYVQAGATIPDAVADIQLNRSHVAVLWKCFAEDFACDHVRTIFGSTQEQLKDFLEQSSVTDSTGLREGPPIAFTSIYTPFSVENSNFRPVPLFIRDYLAQEGAGQYFRNLPETANATCGRDLDCMLLESPPICALGRSALGCILGKCVCSTAYFHDAVSPLLQLRNNRFEILNGSSPFDRLWTEPRWEAPTLVFFFSASNNVTVTILVATGTILTFVTFFVFRRARKLLQNDPKLKLD